MKIAIIGGGFTGLSAAYDLTVGGHQVDLFESTSRLGGLAAGLKEPHWQSSLEAYYHHWFASDFTIKQLLKELRLDHKLIYHRPVTVAYFKGQFYPLDSLTALFKFPGFTLRDVINFGLSTAYLKYFSSWRPLEKTTAAAWITRHYGAQVYQVLWQPLLEGKFGPYATQVNMAWFWARLKARTPNLGTYQGGFQACIDDLSQILTQRGVNIYTSSPIRQVRSTSTDIHLQLGQTRKTYDRCLLTLAPHLVSNLVPALPPAFHRRLNTYKYLGAVVVIFALKQPLSPSGYYWYNLPKDQGFPCLSAVEHTNFVSADHFGGDHLVYCGDYLPPTDPLITMPKAAVVERFSPALKRLNPAFRSAWIKKTWVFRTPYAQPVPFVNHSANLLPTRSPIPSIYLANMAQVYPWDRGTNFAVELGRRVARQMIKDS